MKIKLPLIFLHFSRTGGISLNEVLKENFQPHEMYEVYVQDSGGVPKTVEEDFINLPIDQKRKYQFIYGHFFFGLHSFFEEYTYYTLLRDPVVRIISMYGVALTNRDYYLHDYIVKNKVLLKDLLESNISPEFNSGMVRALAGVKFDGKDCTKELFEIAKKNFDEHIACFGITERFDESIALLNVQFGIQTKISKERLNSQKVDLSYLFKDDDLIELIKERNKYDVQLYNYALEKFDKLIKEHGSEIKIELDKLTEIKAEVSVEAKIGVLTSFTQLFKKKRK